MTDTLPSKFLRQPLRTEAQARADIEEARRKAERDQWLLETETIREDIKSGAAPVRTWQPGDAK